MTAAESFARVNYYWWQAVHNLQCQRVQ